MGTDLSDEAIVREVLLAIRIVGEGKASLASAGERLLRRIVGLEHETRIPGEADPWRNPPAVNTGD